MQFPHCDPRILHAPGECEFCDDRPEWQQLRTGWGIAFTGRQPKGLEPFCMKPLRFPAPPEDRTCLLARGHEGECQPLPEWEQFPCPADAARPPGGISDHRNWHGNRPGS